MTNGQTLLARSVSRWVSCGGTSSVWWWWWKLTQHLFLCPARALTDRTIFLCFKVARCFRRFPKSWMVYKWYREYIVCAGCAKQTTAWEYSPKHKQALYVFHPPSTLSRIWWRSFCCWFEVLRMPAWRAWTSKRRRVLHSCRLAIKPRNINVVQKKNLEIKPGKISRIRNKQIWFVRRWKTQKWVCRRWKTRYLYGALGNCTWC